MTPTKIKKILETFYGISNPFDRWLKLPQISIIHLAQDANIYLDNDSLYYFSSATEELFISTRYSHVNLTNENINPSLDSYSITNRFQLKSIAGFISTSVSGPYGTYINRRF